MVQQYRDNPETQTTPTQYREDQHHAPEQEPVAERPQPTHRADVKTSTAAEVDPVFRGFKSGAAFFGWLIAIGLTVLLTGVVGAIAAAVDYAITLDRSTAEDNAGTIGVVSGAVLVVMMAIAYYNGGYVAGRLARFDGARQGFGVWAIGLVVTLVVAGIGALAGSQYDVLDRVDLPSVPIADETLTTGSVVLAAAVVVVSLLAAVIGGKAGQRYHKRIDNSWS
jgi:heme/copper-type cytochrome/quinol oxidase subunit 1